MIVLDTHAWLWWASEPSRLSPTARAALAEAPAVGVSTLSVWEIATLVRRGRVSLDRDVRDWVRRALADERLEAITPEADVAATAGLLEDGFPGDPADRLIFATARALDALLVTRDARMRAFAPQVTVW